MAGYVDTGALLLLDTCGETGSVALCSGEQVLAEEGLPERMASAAVLGTIEAVLRGAGYRVSDLGGLGIVNGPGSFTGVRVGLAVAKGMCEAADLPVAAVSRLAVLARKGGVREGYAVLRAGRDQMYVRQVGAGGSTESLMSTEALLEVAGTAPVVYAEEALRAVFAEMANARGVDVSAQDAVPLVRERFRAGGDELSTLDANYVRDESAIYARRQSAI